MRWNARGSRNPPLPVLSHSLGGVLCLREACKGRVFQFAYYDIACKFGVSPINLTRGPCMFTHVATPCVLVRSPGLRGFGKWRTAMAKTPCGRT